jgi:hypothetical protein
MIALLRRLRVRRKLAAAFRMARGGTVCLTRDDEEWRHCQVRLRGYWLKDIGPCREYHLDSGSLMEFTSDRLLDTCCCGREGCDKTGPYPDSDDCC